MIDATTAAAAGSSGAAIKVEGNGVEAAWVE